MTLAITCYARFQWRMNGMCWRKTVFSRMRIMKLMRNIRINLIHYDSFHNFHFPQALAAILILSKAVENADLPAHEVFDSLRSQRHRNRQARGLPHIMREALALLMACAPAILQAQETFTTSSAVMPAEVDRIYVRGLQALVKTQNPAGNWPDDPLYGSEPAVVGLAVISMLAHGDDPNSGPYSIAIHRGLDFILKRADAKTGYIGTSMYNHGFGTLALAEAYGAVDEPRLGPALQKSVELIVHSQENNSFHAWRYSPESKDADTTVSGAQMVALLAARNAGIAVPETAIQNGLLFYKTCQTSDGGIGYTSPTAPNGTRSAIACTVYALAKDKTSPVFKSAFEFIKQAPVEAQYAQYYLYYASQAYFHSSPEAWQTWNRENIKMLRISQAAEGYWEGQFGRTFGTSASLLSLALNYRYLPIYER